MPSLPARLLARRALLPPRIQPRAFHHSPRPLASPSLSPSPSPVPPPTALSALASRLSLPPPPPPPPHSWHVSHTPHTAAPNRTARTTPPRKQTSSS
ncbi:hypothetical protein I307_03570, partial [Cryptococcus deuterogattii 99/473]